MDVKREGVAEARKRKQRILYAAGAVVFGILAFWVSRLEPAAPSVDRSTVWMDKVVRGSMLRQVRGPGTLVPVEIRWVAARTEGRVERILTLPGTDVTPDTVLLEMSNPELEQSLEDARLQLRAAEARYEDLEIQLESQLLNQRALAASVQAEYRTALLQLEADKETHAQGIIGDLALRFSEERAKELEERNRLEQNRLEIAIESNEAQLAAESSRVGQLRALYELRRSQVDGLKVRPDLNGVLQQVPVEVGQQVTPGLNLARVAQPLHLKAELRIAETQAKDVEIGQRASIDTRNGLIEGRVMRIDPAVQEGTVTVDVELLGELPRGARPDLSVDGTVEIERLENVLYVGRPAYGQAGTTIGLFRLLQDGETAERVDVSLGKSSVNTIEIVAGLNEGDEVILSDTSQWDDYRRIRLN
ncbi:MAG TPA: HlyD family efflux transporter periplasmic adaptor subunit [Vicinamibacteria bacterium]|nr:HlyD family efflux transporter periplasmic adaptor subunit [Vicinamibacteria bacterium]